jgi:glucokinase
MKAIGIDVGGTSIKAGIVEGKKVLKKIEMKTEAGKGKGKVVQNISKVIELLDGKDIKVIGIGFPGMLDIKREVVLISPHVGALKGFNLKRYFEKKFHKKVCADNEVRAAILTEAKHGAGKGYKNIVMITIGTGIGGGIINNGKLCRGKGSGGEIGHMSINYDGMKSTCCNNYGCFEEYVSERALQRSYGKQISAKEIAERARKGDRKAIEAYQEMGRCIGVGVVNIINSFDPEIVIIGGGLSKSWNLFEKEMKKTIEERHMLSAKVAKAQLEDVGIIGAALLTQRGK